MHFLAQRPVAIDELLSFGKIKLRVGIQELEKFLERAIEVDFIHDRLHRAMDTLDLGKTNLMNGLWRKIGGGRRRDEIRIPRIAIGQVFHTDGRARGREIFIANEVPQHAVNRDQLVLDRIPVCRGQCRSFIFAERFRHILNWPIKQAFLNIGYNVRGQLRHDFFHQHTGHHQPLFHACPHIVARLVHPDYKTVHAPQEILVILDRLERVQAGA